MQSSSIIAHLIADISELTTEETKYLARICSTNYGTTGARKWEVLLSILLDTAHVTRQKKLIHGNDGSHEYLPISKKSSKHAIGKKFLEKFWPDIFSEGIVILPDGKQTTIPRYYEKWLRDTHPNAWIDYVTTTKQKKMTEAALRSHREEIRWWETQDKRDFYKPNLITQVERRKIILRKKFKELQKHLKGDI